MKFLAISGSARRASTNTAMLRALQAAAGPDHAVVLHDGVGMLPVFSPDLEGEALPAAVAELARAVAEADGVIIASPEYVRSIPGGMKNAIDWLVSREELVAKPIVLAHASHRGDDMLQQLRIVLATVSARFNEEIFLRFRLMALSPEEIAARLAEEAAVGEMRAFLNGFSRFCAEG
jgi:NAD(P)H-dependent FMN reductase